MSRCRLITLNPLSEDDLVIVLQRALTDKEKGVGNSRFRLTQNALRHIVDLSEGDVRAALNTLEITVSMLISKKGTSESQDPCQITLEDLENALQRKALMSR